MEVMVWVWVLVLVWVWVWMRVRARARARVRVRGRVRVAERVGRGFEVLVKVWAQGWGREQLTPLARRVEA